MRHGNRHFQNFQKIQNFRFRPLKTTSAEPKITKAPRAWKALTLSHSYESHGAKHSPSDPPWGPNNAKPGGRRSCMVWIPLIHVLGI